MADKGLTRRGFLAGTVGSAALLGLAACRADTPTAAGPSGAAAPAAPAVRKPPTGLLTAALTSLGSERFDPRIDAGDSTQVYGEIFENLLGVDIEGKVDNSGLAERWEIGKDGTSLTLFLRKGVKWHDDTDFTADDVKYSLSTYYATKETTTTGGGFLRSNLKSVEIDNPYQVTIRMKSPVAPLLASFAPVEGQLNIVPKAYLEKNGIAAMGTKPIGTGPWKWSSQVAGQYAELTANESYWNKDRIPGFKTLRFLGVLDNSTRVAMLRTGQADFAVIDPTSVATVQGAGLKVANLPRGSVTLAAFHALRSADASRLVNKLEFRKALNLALDRKAIHQASYPAGTADLLGGSGLFTPGALGDDPALAPYPYQPDEARRLLATVYKGEPITFWSFDRAFAPGQLQINELILGYWTKIGLNVKLVPVEYATLRARVSKGDFGDKPEIAIWAPAVRPSMVSQLQIFLNALTDGGSISLYHDTPKAKAWAAELTVMTDEKALDKRLREINKELYDQYWCVPLAAINIPFAYGKTVRTWEPGALNRQRLRMWSAIPA